MEDTFYTKSNDTDTDAHDFLDGYSDFFLKRKIASNRGH